MAFNNSFTAVTGATYTAAQYNTYVRDNFTAIWVYTTAGDIAYATSSTALSRLGIGASNTVLGSSGSAPQWSHSPPIAGVLHTKGMVTFDTGGQTFLTAAWADITGATLNLSLTVTCTILALAVSTGYENTAGNAHEIRAVINGTADTTAAGSLPFNGGATVARNEALPYIYYATGVTSGTRTVKLQAYGDNDAVLRGRLIALAFVE